MLDKLGIKLLKVIKQMCNADSYSILECAEIIAAVSKDMDNETLKRYIDYFVSQGYIDVKYSDEKQVCLCVLPKAKVADEEVELKKKTSKSYFKLAILVSMLSCIFGFVGAFLGSYVYWIIG
ncbi:MAG: hypothetical protein IJA61_01535 [Clostridia bacterium]|nr:hypothetical protein [Clostridia bacterium]